MKDCNADYKHPCDANDGEPCEDCAAYLKESEAEARREWLTASPEEKDPERYRQGMIDAGRGHLVRR